MKDRSKVTGPSEVIVKANKKAPRISTEDEPSKYRKPVKHAAQADRAAQVALHKPTSRRKKDRRHDSSEESDHDGKHETHKRKKRSTDVQRSMRALKDAVKGRRDNGKRRRNDPLERAANILPAGRVTVSSAWKEYCSRLDCSLVSPAKGKDWHLQSWSGIYEARHWS